jgi:hypothetical protein
MWPDGSQAASISAIVKKPEPVAWRQPGHRWGKDLPMHNPHASQPTRTRQWPTLATQLRRFGILLLSPLIIGVTIAILLGLLGIFVAWLLIVTALVSAIVASDVARRSWRLLVKSQGRALQHRTAGYP